MAADALWVWPMRNAAAKGRAMTADISPILATTLVAVGGAVGAALRYHAGQWAGQWAVQLSGSGAQFPWGTLSVNVIGSLAMGLLAGWLARQGTGAENLRLILGVGLLGGFTTFSAFSLEMMQLVERGSAGLAIGYAGASVLAGLAALYIGLVVMRGAA